jgi:hypothetical protein
MPLWPRYGGKTSRVDSGVRAGKRPRMRALTRVLEAVEGDCLSRGRVVVAVAVVVVVATIDVIVAGRRLGMVRRPVRRTRLSPGGGAALAAKALP